MTLLFKPCLVGELIESGTNNLTRISFESDWINDSMECKKALIIINENLKQPIRLQAFNVFALNLKTFGKVRKFFSIPNFKILNFIKSSIFRFHFLDTHHGIFDLYNFA